MFHTGFHLLRRRQTANHPNGLTIVPSLGTLQTSTGCIATLRSTFPAIFRNISQTLLVVQL